LSRMKIYPFDRELKMPLEKVVVWESTKRGVVTTRVAFHFSERDREYNLFLTSETTEQGLKQQLRGLAEVIRPGSIEGKRGTKPDEKQF
jgi:hypothetical protein